jgi:amino acid adenylation domain-containing protein
VLAGAGELEEAAAAAVASLELLSDCGAGDDPDAANVLLLLGYVRERQGRYADAAAAAGRALSVMEAHADAPGAEIAQLRVQALVAVGNLEAGFGRLAAAETRLLEAVWVAERALGDDHVELAVALNALGVTYKAAARLDDSQRAYERALGILSGQRVPDPVALAALYHNVGGLAFARGEAARGIEWAERGVRLRIASVGENTVESASQLAALAALYDLAGLHDVAEEAYRAALAVIECRLGPDHVEVGRICSNVGVIVARRGDLASAERLYRRALAIKRRVLGGGHPDVALTLHNLGVLLVAAGRRAEAIETLQRAGAILASSVTDAHPRAIATATALGALLEDGLEAPPAPRTAVERFERQVDAQPDRVACSCDGKSLSYGDLDRRANRLAHHLRALGVGRDVPVAIDLERGLDMLVAIIGVLKAGGAYVPLDPEHPAARQRFMVDDSGAHVIVSRRERWPQAPAGVEVVCLDGDAAAIGSRPAQRLEAINRGEDLAYVIYTSGSTGIPKGVMVTHRNVERLLGQTERWFGFGPDDTWALFHSFAFDVSVWEIWGALAYGGRLVVVDFATSRSPERMTRLLVDEGVTVLCQTPSAFRQLSPAILAAGARPPLRYVIFAGEALDFRILRAWFDRFGDERPRCVNMYGITETTVHATYRRVAREEAFGEQSSCIGVPIPDLELLVLDESGRTVAAGEIGELWVAGPGVARGYLNRPELTAERFVVRDGRRMYRSGDLGRLLDNGDVDYVGRADKQVKVRGFRIETGEIEARLLESGDLVDAVVRVAGTGDDARLVAWCLPRPLVSLDRAALRRGLAQSLPSYMIPAAFVALDALPLTVNGKLDVGALPVPEIELADYRPPESDSEALLAELWAQALGGGVRPGRDDSFLALGGSSILAVRVLARIFDARGVELSFRDFFDAPTLGELAAVLDARQRSGASAIERRPPGSPTVLSFAEEQLHHMARLAPRVAVYAECLTIDVSERLRLDVLQRALDEIAERHPILRSRYATEGGVARRVLAPGARIALTAHDLRGTFDEGAEDVWQRLAAARAAERFDLGVGPLLRVDSYRLGDAMHRILVTFHHVVLDGAAAALLVGELAQAYAALAAGEAAVLPVGGLTVDDIAAWQRERLDEVRARELPWWRERLAGIQQLDLAADHPRPLLRSFRGGRLARRLPDEVVGRLRGLAGARDTTFYTALLAGFFALLARHTGQEDLAIGAISGGRSRSEADSVLGCFVNAIVLRESVKPSRSFADLIALTRDTLLDAHFHAELPFSSLVRELGGARQPNRNPLFQVAFSANVPIEDPLAGWSVRVSPLGNGTSRFDLAVQVDERRDGVECFFEYSLDLFEPATIERIADRYLTLLAAAAADPTVAIVDLPLVDERETAMLLALGKGEPIDDGEPVLERFRRHASAAPEALAVAHGVRAIGYRELDRLSDAIADTLIRAGVGAGELVGIATPPCVEWVAGVLGILKAGSAFVPFDPNYPATRLAGMLADSGVAVLCTAGGLPQSLAAFAGRVVDLASCVAAAEPRPLPPLRRTDRAYAIFTSGSTGQPNAAQMEHGNLADQVEAFLRIVPLTSSDRASQFSSPSFDASVAELFPTLCSGAALVIAPPIARLPGAEKLSFLAGERITCAFSSPGGLAAMPSGELPELRLLWAGGDVLGPEVVDRWAAPGRLLLNAYGPTEATVFATFARVAPGDPRPPIGPPTPGARLYVVDAQLRLCAAGIAGELLIGGRGVGRGYLDRAELTARRFLPDPFADEGRVYRTGDLVRWRADGQLEYLGRVDRQVKLRGFRIELGEIEAVIASHPDVAQAVALVREDRVGDRRLVAYHVPRDGCEPPDQAELRGLVAGRLPEFMVPAAFVSIEAVPLNPSGKVDRAALPAPAPPPAAAAAAGVSTDLERAVGGIWSDVLGLAGVGVDDRFFELGGDSLLLARVQAQLRARLGQQVEMTTLLQYPTVRALAGHLRAVSETPG